MKTLIRMKNKEKDQVKMRKLKKIIFKIIQATIKLKVYHKIRIIKGYNSLSFALKISKLKTINLQYNRNSHLKINQTKFSRLKPINKKMKKFMNQTRANK